MIRIRLLPGPKPEWSDPRVEFDPAFSAEECDGLLVWGFMQEEFLRYRGPKAWFLDEPLTPGMFRVPFFKRGLRAVQTHEFLHHSNSDPKYRFPNVTHYGDPFPVDPPVPSSARSDRANARHSAS